MATHSCILAWRIPWTEESGELQCIGSHRVGQVSEHARTHATPHHTHHHTHTYTYMPTTVCLVKAMVFPGVMYECESWTRKKAERRRIGAFELWCWRRLLRVPWTARRSKLSILKKISPECSLEGLMLKLKLQYFGYLMQRADSFEKSLILGKIEGRRRRG